MVEAHVGQVRREVGEVITDADLEVTADVADCPQSLILDQVTNGLAVRMAVLWLICGGRQQVADQTADSRRSV